MKHFLDLHDLDPGELRELLALARRLERSPEPLALAGKILGLLFFNPSLRTLSSMQAAMLRLGGASFVIAPGQGTWQLESRLGVVMDGAAAEHVREAIPVLSGFCDALGIRAFADGKDLTADLADSSFRSLVDLATKPVVNLESALVHPCQGLGDWKTLDDLEIPTTGKLVLAWANHPKALPLAIPTTVVQMAAARGMEVMVLRPDAYALPDPVMKRARGAAAESGGSVEETDDRRQAMAGAHVLYAKSWASAQHYGDAAREAELRSQLTDWTVAESWFDGARSDARFLHCLPVRRNVVVSDEVLDGERSAVIPQAHNRLWAQMAVLHRLLASPSPQREGDRP